MKLALIAVGLLAGSAAHAQSLPPPQPIEQPASHPMPPTCHIQGHPNAVCWWSDPTAQECFLGPIISDKPAAYPARHDFAGGSVCWPGDERFFPVIGKSPRA